MKIISEQEYRQMQACYQQLGLLLGCNGAGTPTAAPLPVQKLYSNIKPAKQTQKEVKRALAKEMAKTLGQNFLNYLKL